VYDEIVSVTQAGFGLIDLWGDSYGYPANEHMGQLVACACMTGVVPPGAKS